MPVSGPRSWCQAQLVIADSSVWVHLQIASLVRRLLSGRLQDFCSRNFCIYRRGHAASSRRTQKSPGSTSPACRVVPTGSGNLKHLGDLGVHTELPWIQRVLWPGPSLHSAAGASGTEPACFGHWACMQSPPSTCPLMGNRSPMPLRLQAAHLAHCQHHHERSCRRSYHLRPAQICTECDGWTDSPYQDIEMPQGAHRSVH